METPASFGQWIRARRRALDMTQELLARAVGCSVVTVRKVEADERRPSRQIAERLADALRVEPAERPRFIGLARGEPFRAPPAAPDHSAAGPRSPIPAPLTRLIGRRAELESLRAELLRGDVRLLTLTGPPGVGKTRLAVEVAAQLRESFPDGACFVDLALVRDPALLPAAIARALGMRPDGGRPAQELLQEALAERQILLLIDNFETVASAAPLLAALLAACPGVRALVTSRAALRVRGEQVAALAPLPLPDAGRPPPLRALAQSPAVALFVERAQAAAPAFVLAEASAPSVAAICARLDGLPLAIELVAARVAIMSPAALLAALDRRLAVLADGPRDLPARHQTLRAALADSYELLTAAEQRCFRRLGVFVGGWDLEAAAAVCPGEAPQEVAAALAGLVAQSLVARGAGEEPRLSMLETIREYALELLAEAGELEAARGAHAAHLAALAERAAPELHGPAQAAWLARLEAEEPNLRAALAHLLRAGEADGALRLAASLWWYWFVRGAPAEGREWLGRALAASAPESGAEAPWRRWRARALHGCGALALFQGDFAAAWEQLGAAAAIWRGLLAAPGEAGAARRDLAATLTYLVIAAQFQSDLAARAPVLAELTELAATLDDPRAQATLQFNMGRGALLQEGDAERARGHLERALAHFRDLGDLWHVVQVELDLGLACVYRGDYAAGEARYEAALAGARALGDRSLSAAALNNLGEVARCRGEHARAGERYAESLALHERLGNRTEVPRLLHNLGYVALARGDAPAAAGSFGASLARFRRLGMVRGVAEGIAGQAAVAAVSGRPEEAARLWGAAEALHERDGTPVWPADRLEHERYQALARAALDHHAWAAAWQGGRRDADALADEAHAPLIGV